MPRSPPDASATLTLLVPQAKMDFVFEQIVFSKRDRQFHIRKPSRLIDGSTAPVARKGMVTPATPICAFCLEAVALRRSTHQADDGRRRVTAHFMRQDNFSFTPQFKLTIVGNHRPVLRNVDEAARRRFNIVPFLLKPENERA